MNPRSKKPPVEVELARGGYGHHVFVDARNNSGRTVTLTDEGIQLGARGLLNTGQRLRACGSLELAPGESLNFCYEVTAIVRAARKAGCHGKSAFSAFLVDEEGQVYRSGRLKVDIDSFPA